MSIYNSLRYTGKVYEVIFVMMLISMCAGKESEIKLPVLMLQSGK